MAKAFIFSTLATDMSYTNWVAGPDENAMKAQGRTIFVKGGAGVANDRIVTPLGVCTEVDDADLEELQKNPVFQMHQKNGHIKVQRKSADPEKVAADMNRADPSSPRTPAFYENSNANEAKPMAEA